MPIARAFTLTPPTSMLPSVVYSSTTKFSAVPAKFVPLVYAQLRCQLPSVGTVNVPVLPEPVPLNWVMIWSAGGAAGVAGAACVGAACVTGAAGADVAAGAAADGWLDDGEAAGFVALIGLAA